jgi:hypothetical protein
MAARRYAIHVSSVNRLNLAGFHQLHRPPKEVPPKRYLEVLHAHTDDNKVGELSDLYAEHPRDSTHFVKDV